MSRDFLVAVVKGVTGITAGVVNTNIDKVKDLDYALTLATKFGTFLVVIVTIVSLTYDVLRKRRRLKDEAKCDDCDPVCDKCPDKQ